LDDVIGARISSVKMVRAQANDPVIAIKNSPNVIVEDAVLFNGSLDNAPARLPRIMHNDSGMTAYPAPAGQ
jgi:hypothetical protein